MLFKHIMFAFVAYYSKLTCHSLAIFGSPVYHQHYHSEAASHTASLKNKLFQFRTKWTSHSIQENLL